MSSTRGGLEDVEKDLKHGSNHTPSDGGDGVDSVTMHGDGGDEDIHHRGQEAVDDEKTTTEKKPEFSQNVVGAQRRMGVKGVVGRAGRVLRVVLQLWVVEQYVITFFIYSSIFLI